MAVTLPTHVRAAVDALDAADRALWDAMGDATPSFTSMPTRGARHELRAVETFAEALGTPFIPWQSWAARVITERSTRDPRRYRFPEVTLTVERQSGKTTLMRAILLTRAILNRGRLSAYTAQTGRDAVERWAELSERVASSRVLGPQFTVRKAAGTQRLTCASTGSRVFPFPPTPDSLHGYTPHDVVLDEIFTLDEVRGGELMGAIKPAQQTLPSRQLLMVSTAGSPSSTFLKGKVDRGRLAVADDGAESGYLEWSFPEGADVYDPDVWVHHPGLGYLVGVDDLRELAASSPPAVWRRAFANQWVDAVAPLFDMEAWGACVGPVAAPALSRCSVGFAVDAGRVRGAVVAAWTAGGVQCVKLMHSTPVVTDMPRLVREVLARKPARLVADDGGYNRTLVDETRRGLSRVKAERVEVLGSREWVLASTSITGKLAAGTVRHDGDPELTAAVGQARSRALGESWALSHNSPAEVLAMAAALRGLDSQRVAAAVPSISFGEDTV